MTVGTFGKIGICVAGAMLWGAALTLSVVSEPALATEPSPVAVRAIAEAVANMPAVTAVRVGGDDAQTRFIMDLTQKIDVAAFALADPYRVVVDLPQVAFRLPDKTGE